MHNSHTVLVVLMFAALAFGTLFPVVRKLYQQTGLSWKCLGKVGALIVACYLAVCTIHWSLNAGFRATQGGSIFLFARLVDFNIPQDYLEEHAEEIDAPVAVHRKTLEASDKFLWGNAPSGLASTGGWSDANKAFYQELVTDILTTPKYFKRYLIRSIEATFAQLFYVDFDPISEKYHHWMFGASMHRYKHYRIAIEQGRQALREYRPADIALFNHLQYFVFLLSVLIVFWGLLYREMPPSVRALCFLLILGLLVNAFIAAATSGVYDRYQSRVAWLITLPAFWMLNNWWEEQRPLLKTFFTPS
jgi:hypothetical protein